MTNGSLARRARLNVPSPNPERGAYTRFIPREELGDFANWTPGSFTASRKAAEAPPAPTPVEPTAQEWQAQIEAAHQAGYQDGYRDGMVALEGFKKSHAEQVNTQVARFLQNLDTEFDALHDQLAQSVTRVAVQLARQVLRAELEIAPAHVATVAAEAVEAVLLSARHITVHVNPHDLPLVAEGAEEALKARGARLVADAAIERGGVLVESDLGSIDARVASRWTQAANALGTDTEWGSEA